MSFSVDDGSGEVMNEINMTPLVDVMLVLLIVFIVTVPVMKHTVTVDLSKAAAQAAQRQPDALQLSISADGIYSLGDEPISAYALDEKLVQAAGHSPQPALHLHGDKSVRYEHVAHAIAAAKRAGLAHVGLMTTP